MNRILVTGGCGFIGSNFIRLLLADQAADLAVVNVDILTYAANPANLGAAADDRRYTFMRADIRDEQAMRRLFAAYDFDAVFNFAAESHVDRSLVSAANFVSTNIGGLVVLLEAARQYWPPGQQQRRFIHISTDEVYGAGADGQCFGENSPLAPRNPYAASKAGAELLALSYAASFGLPLLISRSCNIYGPRQHQEKLIPRLITRALGNQPLPIYGSGEQRREWLYVEDNCRALLAIAARGEPGQSYNIGSGDERRNIDIARTVLERLGKPPELLSFVPDRPGHDFRYGLDCAKIRSLGWQPRTDFAAGLAAAIEFYQR